MRIIGIDPGFALMGYGIVEMQGNKFQAVDYGSLATPAGMDMPSRLKMLYDDLTAKIVEFKPQAASIEELFFNKNITTAIFVAQARGVAILACANAGIPVYEYTPMQIKQALVGYGKAEKKQMQQMTKLLLGLKEVPKPDDTADALAAAICHGNSAGEPKPLRVRKGI
ncbi:MAG: crossover junction endodeoxyribonuclease RuvC [Firmicutes bacterium]|nr:crossover junction endodeoxyribonuclease RuvC [Bacillota bacterium]